MKLKKIASLALAGVMAVSMLAACGNTTPETPNEPDAPATGVSAEVGALVEDAPEFVTFADDAALDSALDYTMGKVGVSTTLKDYINLDTLTQLDDEDTVFAAMIEEVNADENVWVSTIGDIDVTTDGEGAKAVRVYAISNAISDAVVKEYVAEDISEDLATYLAYDASGDNWYYDYTVSVSMNTKTVNNVGMVDIGDLFIGAAEKPTVTFVAVQVVREARAQD